VPEKRRTEKMKKDTQSRDDLPEVQPLPDRAPSGALTQPASALVGTLRSLRAATEIRAISRALEQTGWNRRRAAEMLRISYRGLLYKIRQHNITRGTEVKLATFE
jgi:DNA-binding NtrC family response regulator